MKIKIVAITDLGKERTNNEDVYLICHDLSKQDWSLNDTQSYSTLVNYGSVVVVADGMGGENFGDVASSLAAESVKNTFSNDNIKHFLDEKNINGLMALCAKNADEAINNYLLEYPDVSGMGTTIVICWIINQMAHIAWCGDSRCYVFNPNKGIKQLTKDHSFVQELIDRGEINVEDAFTHPDNNIITRALGDVETTTPEFVSYSLCPNDTLLLCTDGLCGYCKNQDIEKVLQSNYVNIAKCRDELLKLALDAGGFDNVCLALVSLIDDEQNEPSPISQIQKLKLFLKRFFH